MSDTIPDAGDNGLGFGFCAKDVARISETVRRVESAYRNAPPGRAKGPVAASATGRLVRIWMPTGIAAGTFGSPAVKTDAILAGRSGNGWTTSGGATIAHLYNSDTTAVTGAKAGWATKRPDGTYELVIADC